MIQNKSDFGAFEAQCRSLIKDAPAPKISKAKPIYIFGAGGFGKAVAKALKVNNFDVIGFIETSSNQKIVDGLPVVSWSDLLAEDLSAQLLIGIYNRDIPFDGLKNIASTAGFKNIFIHPISSLHSINISQRPNQPRWR